MNAIQVDSFHLNTGLWGPTSGESHVAQDTARLHRPNHPQGGRMGDTALGNQQGLPQSHNLQERVFIRVALTRMLLSRGPSNKAGNINLHINVRHQHTHTHTHTHAHTHTHTHIHKHTRTHKHTHTHIYRPDAAMVQLTVV